MAEGSNNDAPVCADEAKELCIARDIVRTLIRKGIKLLALDFDLTIIDVHTAGAWRGPSTKLAPHVRPCFKALIEAALAEPQNLHICIVTYSSQPGLIEDVLKVALPKHCDVGRIVIRAVSKDWAPMRPTASSDNVSNSSASSSRGTVAAGFLGKEEHLARVTTDLYNWRHVIIQAHEILLIDDDVENVNIAESFGHRAFVILNSVSIEDLVALVNGIPDGDGNQEMPRGITLATTGDGCGGGAVAVPTKPKDTVGNAISSPDDAILRHFAASSANKQTMLRVSAPPHSTSTQAMHDTEPNVSSETDALHRAHSAHVVMSNGGTYYAI